MKTIRIFSRVIAYIKKYKWWYIGGFISLIMTDIFVMISPMLLKRAIDSLDKPDAVKLILLNSLLIAGAGAGIAFFRFLWRKLIFTVSRTIEYELRNDFFRHIQLLHAGYFSRIKTGDLMSKATNDMQAVREFLAMGLLLGFDTFLVFGFALFMMIRINLNLTLWVLIPVPFMVIIIRFIANFIFRQFEKVQEQLSVMSAAAQENFSGIRVVKSYAKESYESEKFKEHSKQYFDKYMKLTKIDGLFMPSMETVMQIGVIIILFKGGSMIIADHMTFGEFVAFIGYVGILSWPIFGFGWIINLMQRGKASMMRINEVFDTKPEILDNAGFYSSKNRISGEVEFKNVFFSYSKETPFVLEDISFKIQRGMTVAIVGATGSGKSTLINLIPRYYDPSKGTVLVDGVSANRIPLSALRKNIGLVSQEPFLFSDTIKENISFGNPDASEDKVKKYAEIAELSAEIESFPKGYGTIVGERGITLSGGQKQRVAIARALFIEPPILILDDALSSVDSSTEKKIVGNLKIAMKDKTSFIISHRVSTIRIADIIIVLDNGKLVEIGTHNELVGLKGFYNSFCEKQKIKELIEAQ